MMPKTRAVDIIRIALPNQESKETAEKIISLLGDNVTHLYLFNLLHLAGVDFRDNKELFGAMFLEDFKKFVQETDTGEKT